jgi:hypothetical protein
LEIDVSVDIGPKLFKEPGQRLDIVLRLWDKDQNAVLYIDYQAVAGLDVQFTANGDWQDDLISFAYIYR